MSFRPSPDERSDIGTSGGISEIDINLNFTINFRDASAPLQFCGVARHDNKSVYCLLSMNIKLQQFEGPLDLLLQMIEEQKLDITEVSLAAIAERYVERIRQNGIEPEELADFLVIAAKLLLIKSKTLLPYLVRDEEEAEIKDFANQLKIYKDFLAASKKITGLLGERRWMFAREFNKKLLTEEKFFYPPQNVTARALSQTYQELVGRLKVE